MINQDEATRNVYDRFVINVFELCVAARFKEFNLFFKITVNALIWTQYRYFLSEKRK